MKLVRLISLSLTTAVLSLAQRGVYVNRYDSSATGANVHESVLNAGSVAPASFGRLYSYYVDGAVYAQPLYVPSLRIPGRGVRNVLFVATMNDRMYAFDADKKGAPLWMRDFTDELKGITPVPVTDITHNPDLNLVGGAGIEGTPVIDPVQNAIFLVVRTKENGEYVQRLRKLSLADGRDLRAAVIIEAQVSGVAKDAAGGRVSFDPRVGNQRPALALVNGNVVIAWASHEDIGPYHGWIMAYDTAALRQTAVFCVTPDGAEGGVWQSGRGPVIDSSGSIYFETGNGDWNGERDWGTSLLKLALQGGHLSVEDYFTPHDYEALNARDTDLGSSGPMLIPGTGLVVCGSKKGVLYLLDTRKLGRMTPEDAGVIQQLEIRGGRVLAGPAWWDGPGGPALYLWLEADFAKAYRFHDGRFDAEPFASGTVGSKGSPGGALTISSDGSKPGTGILWATLTVNRSADHGNAPGVLRALNAETLRELWNSEQQPKRDRLGTLVKFAPPLVAAGRVYVPNYDNAVNVYGLLPQ